MEAVAESTRAAIARRTFFGTLPHGCSRPQRESVQGEDEGRPVAELLQPLVGDDPQVKGHHRHHQADCKTPLPPSWRHCTCAGYARSHDTWHAWSLHVCCRCSETWSVQRDGWCNHLHSDSELGASSISTILCDLSNFCLTNILHFRTDIHHIMWTTVSFFTLRILLSLIIIEGVISNSC